MSNDSILVTGAGGFIGFHLSKRLCSLGYNVIGLDNLNTYYDVNLKTSRLSILKENSNFHFRQLDVQDKEKLFNLFSETPIENVVHLAAQAGVRYSLSHPDTYVETNIYGFLNILESCRNYGVNHLLYASSSSVYGANRKIPFSPHDSTDHPLSLYAASKKANELMAHTYSSLFNIPCTGLRFFSVYGTYGRPDMALFLFTKSILEGKAIDVFNNGVMQRAFTHVNDVVECIMRLLPKVPAGNSEWNGANPDPASSFAPYRIVNIGNRQHVTLMEYIEMIEKKLNKKAIKNFLPLQEGDVPEAMADISDLEKLINFTPSISVEKGVSEFIDWYFEYYNITR